MNTLIYFAVVLCASAGVIFRQQSAVDDVWNENRRLNARLAEARAELDSGRSQLETARSNWNGMLEGRIGKHAPAGLNDVQTPEREGWWPGDREYFYLAKGYLHQVRLRTLRLPPAEAHAQLTNGAATAVTYIENPDADQAMVHHYLFENGKLNRTIAVMFGMAAAELEQVDEIYAKFFQSLQEIEARRVECVDPPQRLDVRGSPQWLVARLPDISDEVKPMLSMIDEQLNGLLGAQRAEMLVDHVRDYLVQNCDGGGSKPREFIRMVNTSIMVQRIDFGTKLYSSEVGLPITAHSKYAHLFGPNRPCELK